MFPQYASATTGSVHEKVMNIVSKWWSIPEVVLISQFYDEPLYIQGYVDNAKQFDLKEYDRVLFSFHGLPERQLDKLYDDNKCRNHSCEHEINEENHMCYKATCYATARAIAAGVGLNVTKANHIIHYTRHWNPAKEDQATDRAHRIVQKKDVFVYLINCRFFLFLNHFCILIKLFILFLLSSFQEYLLFNHLQFGIYIAIYLFIGMEIKLTQL